MKKIPLMLAVVAILGGCAGRTPNPCSVVRPGDNERSCSYLLSEIKEIETNIARLLPESEKTGQNVALGVAGAFFIAPLFFMDFSEAEKVEIQAFQARHNHLVRLYNEKRCTDSKKLLSEIKISGS